MLAAAGCGGKSEPTEKFDLVVGSRGNTAGKFTRPRGIDYSPVDGFFYCVDWSGRIQKFSGVGRFRAVWIVPDIETGKPEEVYVAPDGNILVADTHYSRILEYTPEGDLVGSFGEYGVGPGQFVYPVSICCDTNGNIFVSEYGKNDRIQKFTRSGKYICEWGGYGTEPGRLQRPAGICYGPDNTVLVADAVNHRIQRFTADGKLVKIIGKQGTGPGEFRYPYDVEMRSNVLYVLEYGNQRLQKLTLEGEPIAMFGKPGSEDGCFASPWRFTMTSNAVFVSDTDNNRVVKLTF
jgi:DNA-binding beta-propeller fold protein YncE